MAIHCQVAAAAGSEKQNESLIQTPNCRHEKQNTLPCRSVRCWFANAEIKRFAFGFWGSFSNIKGVYSTKIQFNSQPSLLGHKSIFTQWCRCETDTSNSSGLVVWPATHHAQKDCDPKVLGLCSLFVANMLLYLTLSSKIARARTESTAGGLNWRMQVKQSNQQLRLLSLSLSVQLV